VFIDMRDKYLVKSDNFLYEHSIKLNCFRPMNL
jgi:hypothetical protein